jgi:LPS export ABC transporter permease LptF/LPS export ABC transporter permease LptG
VLRILDRYVLRQVLTPFLLALLVFTFVLEIPPILSQGEDLIAKGVSWAIVARVLLTLLPQALGITIPIALLMGVLIAFGRLSGDRETVALEACGVSVARLLRPVGLLAIVAMAATTYIMIVALPAANQAYRELVFRIVSTRAESEVKPRVFFDGFPNLVLYVREVTPGEGWSGVMVADSSNPDDSKLYLATKGRVLIDAQNRTVQVVLERGTQHSVKRQQPDKYQLVEFDQTILSVNPESVFPRQGPMKGDNEMTIAELNQRIAEYARDGSSPHNQIMAIQKKFSIPVACLVFALIGVGLGVSNRRDGKLASFVLGIGVVFLYYALMTVMGQSAKGALVPAWLAMWVPDIAVGLWGAILLTRRLRSSERPLRLPLPFLRRKAAGAASLSPSNPSSLTSASVASSAKAGNRPFVVIRVSQLSIPKPNILDLYVTKQALRVSLLAGAALLGLFYISTFIDLSDKLFKGTASGSMILLYFWFETPQFAYYVIPLAVLMGALVTVGALTKNTELVVMKACGVSLYRAAAPLLVLAAIGGAMLFGLEERVLAYANRRANVINDIIRERTPRAYDLLNRQWIAAKNGDLYHYVYFDSARNQLNGLSVYQFDQDPALLAKRTYVAQATFQGSEDATVPGVWKGHQGWEWQVSGGRELTFNSFAEQPLTLEPPGYFASERPDAEQMSFTQLRAHVAELQASGFNVVPYVVDLHRKLAFPFITIIMALIAVPFAVTTGKRGALYGIGAGLVLAIVYWTTISVFGAIGSGGLMAPALAAWAPNAIFGCVALYLLLTVRT